MNRIYLLYGDSTFLWWSYTTLLEHFLKETDDLSRLGPPVRAQARPLTRAVPNNNHK